MTNFTIPEIDYSTLGRDSYKNLKVAVVGFWSQPVEIYISRESRFDQSPEWRVEVSHSSGGKEDDGKTLTRLQSERNFAQAILASIEVAEEILSKTDILESNHQSRLKEDEAVEAKRKAELAAKVADDTEITKEQIDQLMKDFVPETELSLFARGSNYSVNFEKSDSNRRIYYIHFGKKQSISTNDLCLLLVGKSARSKVVKKV